VEPHDAAAGSQEPARRGDLADRRRAAAPCPDGVSRRQEQPGEGLAHPVRRGGPRIRLRHRDELPAPAQTQHPVVRRPACHHLVERRRRDCRHPSGIAFIGIGEQRGRPQARRHRRAVDEGTPQQDRPAVIIGEASHHDALLERLAVEDLRDQGAPRPVMARPERGVEGERPRTVVVVPGAPAVGPHAAGPAQRQQRVQAFVDGSRVAVGACCGEEQLDDDLEPHPVPGRPRGVARVEKVVHQALPGRLAQSGPDGRHGLQQPEGDGRGLDQRLGEPAQARPRLRPRGPGGDPGRVPVG